MNPVEDGTVENRSIAVAVTHDHAHVWLMNEDSATPISVIHRVEGDHVHVRGAQAHHGHAAENGETDYFADVAREIERASSILLLGHGTGKANAAGRFSQYLRDHHKTLAIKVMASETVNLPALSNGEIVHEAHRLWRAMTLRSSL
jgi:hypothetical protein